MFPPGDYDHCWLCVLTGRICSVKPSCSWNKGLNPVFRFTMCVLVKLTDVRGVRGTPFSALASPISSTNKILSSFLNMNNLTCRYTTLISDNARFDFYTFEFQILHHTRVVFPITFLNLFPAQILQRIIIQFILKENLFPFQLSYEFSSDTNLTYFSYQCFASSH